MGTREIGGARRDRTVDLLHAMQALSQLSYGPTSRGRILRKLAKSVNGLRTFSVAGPTRVADRGVDASERVLPPHDR